MGMEKPPELGGYPEGASEPVIQRLHRKKTGSGDLNREMTERPQVTPEMREKYDRELVALSRLMKDASVWWQLDGTMNVSLLQKEKGGDYIGEHADIDMSVLRKDLPKLQEYFRSRGYGLFLRTRDADWRTWRRVGAEVFRHERGVAPHIVAIDEGGVIRKDTDLTKVEIAVIDFDQEGFPVRKKVRYPKEWLMGRIINFQGEQIHLSHPARFLMWKLDMSRGYDEKDIDLLGQTGALTLKDIDDVQRVFDELEPRSMRNVLPGVGATRKLVMRRLAKLRRIIGGGQS